MKLIIDVDKDYYEMLKHNVEHGEKYKPFEIIANGTPYNPTGDCISRELLKKDIDAQISDFNELNKKGEPYKEFKDIRAILFGLFIGKNLIDNAPTIPIPNEQIAWEQGYEAGLAQGKQDRPQGDLISRSDALKAVDARHEELLHDTEYRRKHCQIDLLGIKKHILAIPPVEPEKGEWARHDEWRGGEYIGGFYHVNCPCEDGYYSKWRTNFCPNCGLPMKKGGAEE